MDRRPPFLVSIALAPLLLAAALGCQPSPAEVADGDDPLAALRATAATSRYKEPYWAEQCHRGNVTWQDALAFCRGEGKDETRYPNCDHVRIVALWDEPPPMPEGFLRSGDAPALHLPVLPSTPGERP
jgi:hypothetical protein